MYIFILIDLTTLAVFFLLIQIVFIFNSIITKGTCNQAGKKYNLVKHEFDENWVLFEKCTITFTFIPFLSNAQILLKG